MKPATTMSTWDVEKVRRDFPVLSQTVNGKALVYLDNGASSQVPQSVIDQLQLPKSGSVDAILADGSTIELSTYTCLIAWFGKDRRLVVVANDGEHALLGIGLLLAKELRIDYRNLRVSLLPVEKQS